MTGIRFWLCVSAALTVLTGFSGLAVAEGAPPETPQTVSPPHPVSPENPDVATPAPQPAAVTAAEEKKDPCAAYSYEYYVVCRDRMRKIQSMLDARDQRNNTTSPKSAPPVATDASKGK
ncbi:MAG: hypothetical protein V1721_03950 [Pseudomonadota bacterium]